jgi:hypothetical protein
MYNDVAAWCMRVCALSSIVLSISRWNLHFFKKSGFFDKSKKNLIHLVPFWEKIFLEELHTLLLQYCVKFCYEAAGRLIV